MPVTRFHRTVAAVLVLVGMSASCDRGIIGYERIQLRVNVPPGTAGSQNIQHYVANCSPGKKVLGGGYHRPQEYQFFEVWTSQPSSDTGWTVEVWNKATVGWPLVVIAVCAKAK